MRRPHYWPYMVADMYTTITKCSTCAQNRLSLRPHTSPLTLLLANEPLTDSSVDSFGPVPATKAGSRCILVITDRFYKLTNSPTLRYSPAISVETVIIDAWVVFHRPPDRIVPDQRPQFTSNFVVAVMRVLGTDSVRTTAYHRRTNG